MVHIEQDGNDSDGCENKPLSFNCENCWLPVCLPFSCLIKVKAETYILFSHLLGSAPGPQGEKRHMKFLEQIFESVSQLC